MSIFFPFLIVIFLAVAAYLIRRLGEAERQLQILTARLARLEKQATANPGQQPHALGATLIRSYPGNAGDVSIASARSGTDWAIPAAQPPIPPIAPALSASPSHPITPPRVDLPAPPLISKERSSPTIGQGVDWEKFMGVKLFAWLGGFALFLGVAFFIKYSFDHNLIPPELRAAIGFVAGTALLISGVAMKRRAFVVTSQTFCATGVVILYTVTYACRSIYHFPLFGEALTFLCMALITAMAFTLAVRLEACVVAVLGLLGGFLTPILLSTGQNNPTGLFSYVALLDLGLLAVALRRRWAFLIALGATATVMLQVGWVHEFFDASQTPVARIIFLGFDLLFLIAFVIFEKRGAANRWLRASAVGLPFTTFAFVLYLFSVEPLGTEPGTLFSFVLGADLCLLGLALVQPTLARLPQAAGMAVFALLAIWMARFLTPSLLIWSLGLTLAFAVLHAVYPVALAHWRPTVRPSVWEHAFPLAGLVLMFIPVLKLNTVGFALWPAVLLIDSLTIILMLATASISALLMAVCLTGALTATWLVRLPNDLNSLPGMLVVIGGFAALFITAGRFAISKSTAKSGSDAGKEETMDAQLGHMLGVHGAELAIQVPVSAAVLPFFLLMIVAGQLPLSNPSPVYGLALVLAGALLAMGLLARMDLLVPTSLLCVLGLELLWHQVHFQAEARWIALFWNLTFYAIYTVFPFLWRARLANQVWPWTAAALAGPLHFYILYRVVTQGFAIANPGFLPALMAIPMFLAVARIATQRDSTAPARVSQLAWLGGSALFFVTLVFPVQFEHQWLTLSWALEGVALVWLFGKVPHPGLRATGIALLSIAFVRLALNPAVLEYPRSNSLPLLNWYTYTYGIVTLCFLTAARRLAPPQHLGS